MEGDVQPGTGQVLRSTPEHGGRYIRTDRFDTQQAVQVQVMSGAAGAIQHTPDMVLLEQGAKKFNLRRVMPVKGSFEAVILVSQMCVRIIHNLLFIPGEEFDEIFL